ncbi:TIGR03757 family integrating conjugative element protein [Acidovorax sp. YS12]|nr:TIGR03757 family integrating conjugative element protein [Acidovorax sp. YS12]
MPFLPRSLDPRCKPFIGLCALLVSVCCFAADVIAVTDSRHPVRAPAGTRVILLDAPARIEAELAAHLPADPARSAALVRQRLGDGGAALQRRIAPAYQGVVDAWSLRVTTIPAVIVDRRYVVYGETDVAKATARVAAYRAAQP